VRRPLIPFPQVRRSPTNQPTKSTAFPFSTEYAAPQTRKQAETEELWMQSRGWQPRNKYVVRSSATTWQDTDVVLLMSLEVWKILSKFKVDVLNSNLLSHMAERHGTAIQRKWTDVQQISSHDSSNAHTFVSLHVLPNLHYL
jgi:hypothetical protein